MRLSFLVLLISSSAQLPCVSALLVPSSMQDSTVKESPQWGWGVTWKAMERKVVNTKG